MKIKKLNLKNSKGEIELNTIVMAVIAITVLIVVITIFVKFMKKPTKEMEGLSEKISLTDCGFEGKGEDDAITGNRYYCVEDKIDCIKIYDGTISLLRQCKEDGLKCCVY